MDGEDYEEQDELLIDSPCFLLCSKRVNKQEINREAQPNVQKGPQKHHNLP